MHKVTTLSRFKKGFTLLEIVIVVAIMGILALISVTGLQSFAYRSGHISASRTVLGALEEAQARTLASQDDTVFGVHFETDSVTIFQGSTYTAGNIHNEIRILPARTSISTVTLFGGGSNVLFNRLNGTTSHTGTIQVVVTADTTAFRTITVYKTGFCEIQ